MISVPEPTQLLIKPFDASSLQTIIKAIQASGLGLNPVAEGKAVRLSLPSLSGDRRNQLVGQIKQMGEQAKVVVRNARRDGNKHLDTAIKDKSLGIPEDEGKRAKTEIDDLTKKYEKMVEDLIAAKSKEIQEI